MATRPRTASGSGGSWRLYLSGSSHQLRVLPRATASRTRLIGGVPGPVDGGLECRGPGGRRELELANEVPSRLAESPGVLCGLPHLEDACARLDGADDPAEAAVRERVVTSGALVHRLVPGQVEVVVPFQEGAERHDGLLVTPAPSPRTRRGRRQSARGPGHRPPRRR